MKKYVDGFVLCVPKKNMKSYKKMAEYGANMWMKNGAIEYMECKGNDLKGIPGSITFPKLAKAKKDEIVMFSFIVYKSKADRDRINKKVMSNPKMEEDMKKLGMPFDMKKMAYGGFETIVCR